jgi:hypothetical protein
MKTMGLSRLSAGQSEALSRRPGGGPRGRRRRHARTGRGVYSIDAALADCAFAYAISARQRNLGPPPLPARSAAAEILARAAEGEVALLFGNETAGLSNAEVQRCQRTVFIPANPEYTSLNLASAVQLLCYELRLAAFDGLSTGLSKAVPFASPPAPHQDSRTLYRASRAGDGEQRFSRPACDHGGCCPSCVACSDAPSLNATRSTSCADCSMRSNDGRQGAGRPAVPARDAGQGSGNFCRNSRLK